MRVQDVGLSGKSDLEVLAWALVENRILLTPDVKTIPALAFGRQQSNQPISGILLTHWDAPIGQIIADLLLLIECSEYHEWEGRIHYLPF